MRNRWWLVPGIVAPAVIPAPLYAVQYLSVDQAQQLMFPDAARFERDDVSLTREQTKAVERYARVGMRFDRQPVWRALGASGELLGWFVADEVYGKHELITYAVALSRDGEVLGVEIMEYRETHGGEVRDPRWLDQFEGRRYGEPLRLGDTVANISGATLSCKHLTEGVRRILALHREVLAEPAAEVH